MIYEFYETIYELYEYLSAKMDKSSTYADKVNKICKQASWKV